MYLIQVNTQKKIRNTSFQYEVKTCHNGWIFNVLNTIKVIHY